MSYDTSDPTLPPPPPQSPLPPPPPPRRRLVRDPYSRLGGVASGLAHHYGIDVSLVRIAFVLTAFATGFGFLAYLLAWLVIPRADYWPPAGSTGSVRNLSGRELGIGLAIVGLLVALSLGSSGPGSILLPLALVGGGVWLLIQSPNDPGAGTTSTTTGSTGPADDPFGPPVEPAFDTASSSVRLVLRPLLRLIRISRSGPGSGSASLAGSADRDPGGDRLHRPRGARHPGAVDRRSHLRCGHR